MVHSLLDTGDRNSRHKLFKKMKIGITEIRNWLRDCHLRTNGSISNGSSVDAPMH